MDGERLKAQARCGIGLDSCLESHGQYAADVYTGDQVLDLLDVQYLHAWR